MLNVVLKDKEGFIIANLSVPQELIESAAIITYDARYFTYRGTDGRFFSEVTFGEVNAPTEVSTDFTIIPPDTDDVVTGS